MKKITGLMAILAAAAALAVPAMAADRDDYNNCNTYPAYDTHVVVHRDNDRGRNVRRDVRDNHDVRGGYAGERR